MVRRRRTAERDGGKHRPSVLTCAGCEHHVNATANKLKGVQKSDASYKKGKARITFDKSIVTLKEIEEAIEEGTGYTITDYKKKNNE